MELNQINWIDGISLAVITWFSLVGLWVGLAQSIFNLLALSVAVGFSWVFTSPCLQLLKSYLALKDNQAFYQIAVAIVLFLIVYLVVRKAGVLIHTFLHKNALGVLNRMGGLGFGLLKALLLLSAFMVLLEWIPAEFIEPSRQKSHAFALFQKTPIKTWVLHSPLAQGKAEIDRLEEKARALPTQIIFPSSSVKQSSSSTMLVDEKAN